MASERLVITTWHGDGVSIPMESEGGRQVATILIDGVWYHIERMRAAEFCAKYTVDTDPDYEPQTDQNGDCVIVAPFSHR